jgi:hypothetical protein
LGACDLALLDEPLNIAIEVFDRGLDVVLLVKLRRRGKTLLDRDFHTGMLRGVLGGQRHWQSFGKRSERKNEL